MAHRDSRGYLENRFVSVLDSYREQGRTARFWWRDDDAVRSGPALEKLFATTAGAPLALAVIPEPADSSLVDALAGQARVCVFQHGWAHVNHAPRGQNLGAWELDGYRPSEQVLAEAGAGKARLEELFGDRFVPVLVPPWNRIHEPLLPALADMGFCGVSAAGTRGAFEVVAGLRRIDCQFDVLRWKSGTRFAGWQRAADELTAALADPASDDIIGINTHHGVTDAEGWSFIECLNRLVIDHPAADWARPEQLFTQP